ncbi:MAG TPA: hypothetical protein DCZ44_01410 [Flavobacteriaceae bacterium]|nr:hypothetical protein [Flavobacteriaceae bacterium]
MFYSIVSQTKFWRSVLGLALGFAVIFIVIKGLLAQGSFLIFFNSWRNVLGLILGSLIYGFFAAYSRFYKHFKARKQ